MRILSGASLDGTGIATPRFAVIGPYAAAWLMKRVERGGGALGPQVRAQAAMLRGIGREDLAVELEQARRQLVASAQDHRARWDAATGAVCRDASALPQTEAPSVGVEACSLVTANEIATGAAGALLGVSSRTVTEWLAGGRLTGRKIGRAWLVDVSSVNRLRTERNSA